MAKGKIVLPNKAINLTNISVGKIRPLKYSQVI